ncbi:MAG: sugar ABC transporter ATP-binding protein [Parabacteroides sp.]|nr:sugar ABC transporter ATP-binding protein [Parabacteroides sp.]
MNGDTILEMKNITKRFPGVTALKNVQFSCLRGETHALLGENGAGKSTLIKLLSGNSFPTEGTIIFDGKELDAKTPHQAMEKGIAIIYQELNLVGELNAVENIFLGREHKKGPFVDFKKMKEEADQILKSMELKINMDIPISKLSVAQQQMVEIAKALSMNSKLIVMDEPTATLTSHEVSNLFKVIRRLKKEGVTIIFISHHLEETFELCDRMSVLKDGEYMGTYEMEGMTEERIIQLMVGRELKEIYPPKNGQVSDEVVLSVRGITNEKVKDVSFDLRKGEILGISGLVGAGRTELVRAIFKADPMQSGEIYLRGSKKVLKNPRDAIQNGIALLTEDRKMQGLVLGLPIVTNITLPILNKVRKGLFINKKVENKIANDYVNSLKIATPSISAKALNLSGGNQQKVVIAKCLAANCEILILDEPTRGIDVGAKVEIYNLMKKLCKQGKSVIMISSELPEIISMSDRILVMRDGKVNAEIIGEDMTEEIIMQYAMG